MPLPTTSIARCTTRLLCGPQGGEPVSVGTGFFYQSRVPNDIERSVLLVITNKHVIAGHAVADFNIASVPLGIDPDLPPPEGAVMHHRVQIALNSSLVIPHPDSSVDLCALVCTQDVAKVAASGRTAFLSLLNADFLIPLHERSLVRYVERVAMVGYPNGLWDEINDLPIIRQGSTATHPFISYRGRPEFLIDMACLPGSSGSPVFLFEDGFFRAEGGGMTPGTKIALLGVLWGGPQISVKGELEALPAPHSINAIPVTSLPMNLGYIVQADCIATLEVEVHRRFKGIAAAGVFPSFGGGWVHGAGRHVGGALWA